LEELETRLLKEYDHYSYRYNLIQRERDTNITFAVEVRSGCTRRRRRRRRRRRGRVLAELDAVVVVVVVVGLVMRSLITLFTEHTPNILIASNA